MATLLITGATGNVGPEVLRTALASPDVGRVLSIARRPLPASINLGSDEVRSKLTELIIQREQDWLEWPQSIVSQLGYVDATIWLLGVTPSKTKEVGIERVRTISVEYPLAGLRAMLASRAGASKPAQGVKAPLRCMYFTGSMVEPNQDAQLWMLAEMRKARGAGEVALTEFEKERGSDDVQVVMVRPGLIIREEQGLMFRIALRAQDALVGMGVVPVKTLAKTVLAAALQGTDKSILTNEDLRSRNI